MYADEDGEDGQWLPRPPENLLMLDVDVIKKSFVESHFLLLIHTVISQRSGTAEEIDLRCHDKRHRGLLPSLHQGLAPRVPGCTGFTECRQAERSASANTILKMSLETEKVSQPRQFPVLTRTFFIPTLSQLSCQCSLMKLTSN